MSTTATVPVGIWFVQHGHLDQNLFNHHLTRNILLKNTCEATASWDHDNYFISWICLHSPETFERRAIDLCATVFVQTTDIALWESKKANSLPRVDTPCRGTKLLWWSFALWTWTAWWTMAMNETTICFPLWGYEGIHEGDRANNTLWHVAWRKTLLWLIACISVFEL